MIKVNMMSGKRNWGPDWHHIDGGHYPHIHDHDITCQLFESNSVDLIFCSHGIAYFDREEIKPLLKAWYKVLKPGGVLRLATPDFWELQEHHQDHQDIDKILGPLFGKMKMDGGWIYHKTVYTHASLHEVLSNAGFTNVREYDHTKTEHPNTGNREDFFDDHSAAYINGTLISLNLECQKPL